jgi:hypothetical protein
MNLFYMYSWSSSLAVKFNDSISKTFNLLWKSSVFFDKVSLKRSDFQASSDKDGDQAWASYIIY